MRSTSLVFVALGILAMVSGAFAQGVSVSSSATSGNYFASQPSEPSGTVLAAIIGGMFAFAGTVFVTIFKYNARKRSHTPQRRSRKKSRTVQAE